MVDVKRLESVLDKTKNVVAGVRRAQYDLPTPCPDYDVHVLVNHIVGWVGVFAGGAEGRKPTPNAAEVEAGDQPEREFGNAAERALTALADAPDDQPVTLAFGELPASMTAGMMLMEFIGHGWDLAVATRQQPPYNDEEASAALDFAKGMLKPEYQGEGKSFGTPITVRADAPVLDQLIAFLGRDPQRARQDTG